MMSFLLNLSLLFFMYVYILLNKEFVQPSYMGSNPWLDWVTVFEWIHFTTPWWFTKQVWFSLTFCSLITKAINEDWSICFLEFRYGELHGTILHHLRLLHCCCWFYCSPKTHHSLQISLLLVVGYLLEFSDMRTAQRCPISLLLEHQLWISRYITCIPIRYKSIVYLH